MEEDGAALNTFNSLKKGKDVVEASTPIDVRKVILKFGGSTFSKFSQNPDERKTSKMGDDEEQTYTKENPIKEKGDVLTELTKLELMGDDEEQTHTKENPIKEKGDVLAELTKLELMVAQWDEKVRRINAVQVNKKKEKYELKEMIIKEHIKGEIVFHLEEYNKKVLLLEKYDLEERKILPWFESHGLTEDSLDEPCHCLTFKKCDKESKRRNIEELIQIFGKVPYIIQVATIMHLWDVKVTHGPHAFLYLMIVMFLLSSFLLMLRHFLIHLLGIENPNCFFKYLEKFSRISFWLICAISLVIVCVASFIKGSP